MLDRFLCVPICLGTLVAQAVRLQNKGHSYNGGGDLTQQTGFGLFNVK